MTEMRREDIIQMAQMATNQKHLMEGQKAILDKLDRIEQRLNGHDTRITSISTLAATIVSIGTSLAIEKLKLSI